MSIVEDTSASQSDFADLERARQMDRHYYVIQGAILLYRDNPVRVIDLDGPNGNVTIKMLSDGNVLNVSREELVHSIPKENDRVRVVFGRLEGHDGQIIGIDGIEAIVQIDGPDKDIHIMNKNLVVTI
ncbi:hypothetical protein RFI_04916 [Reticulomyxa filosa]|uniref:Spt5 KOW domain-containing protein n=1 Tax=Reticulomyxa filosa TaxID=46433 RepID=X6P3Q1_RETFI|nr:hypothetical protein RFI_04916 [Reticulomyxa filosa]|eukprot:ETO32202.1 hypothetical protein RFI_04916 [Reticulomyxa filosa]